MTYQARSDLGPTRVSKLPLTSLSVRSSRIACSVYADGLWPYAQRRRCGLCRWETARETYRETEVETVRETGVETGVETGRETGRETSRQKHGLIIRPITTADGEY